MCRAISALLLLLLLRPRFVSSRLEHLQLSAVYLANYSLLDQVVSACGPPSYLPLAVRVWRVLRRFVHLL